MNFTRKIVWYEKTVCFLLTVQLNSNDKNLPEKITSQTNLKCEKNENLLENSLNNENGLPYSLCKYEACKLVISQKKIFNRKNGLAFPLMN